MATLAAAQNLTLNGTGAVVLIPINASGKELAPITVTLAGAVQQVSATALVETTVAWANIIGFLVVSTPASVNFNWSGSTNNPSTAGYGQALVAGKKIMPTVEAVTNTPFDSAASAAVAGVEVGLDLLVARLASKKHWITSPGFDVIWIGDSIPVTGSTSVGSSANGRYRSTAVHTLSKILQAKYNPNGVTGGLGYIPFFAGGTVPVGAIANGGDSICTTADALNVASGDTCVQWSTSAVGTGGRDLGFQTGTTRSVGGQLQSSLAYAAQDRALIDKFILVGRKSATGGILAIDAGSGWVARGAGGAGMTFTWDTNGATEYGARSSLMSCTTTLGDHRIIFRGAASGNAPFVDGVIYFIGDSVSGVRSHGLTNPGSRLNLYGTDSQAATINPWTLHSGIATSGGLVIISSLLNEATAGVTAGAYNTTLVDWIDKILARPSTPGVLLVVPVEPYFTGGLTEANYDALVSQLYTTARAYETAGSPVALLDLNVAFGLNGSRYDGLTRQLGVLNNDFTHLSNYGHSRFADAIAAIFEQAWG